MGATAGQPVTGNCSDYPRLDERFGNRAVVRLVTLPETAAVQEQEHRGVRYFTLGQVKVKYLFRIRAIGQIQVMRILFPDPGRVVIHPVIETGPVNSKIIRVLYRVILGHVLGVYDA